MTSLVLAALAFLGTHFILSHPLRRPLVDRLGERGFLILYTLVAIGTMGWLVAAYRAAPATPFLWPVGDALWAMASLVMLVAAVLLMGSLVRNPALPTGGAAPAVPAAARGVYAVTRHPMMWSFALWGGCHVAVYPMIANVILSGAIVVLALAGAAMQDRKKQALQPALWPEWEARTSYWPLAAIAAGRARAGGFGRGGFGAHALAGGVVVWLAATWAHLPLAGWAAGIWRWV